MREEIIFLERRREINLFGEEEKEMFWVMKPIKNRKNCNIGLYGCPKLQIRPCDIKINSKILMVGLIYK
jgi:hypothetical protein